MINLRLLFHCFCTSFLIGIYWTDVSNGSPTMSIASQKSTVHIKEERPADSFVVNVAELFEADKYELSRGKFKFKLLGQKLKTPGSEPQEQASTWVKLDSKTGVLTTSRKIDRDAECAGISRCVVLIEVYMLSQNGFTLMDLEMVIDDVNDNAPDFQRDVIDIKINEAFQVGEAYNLDPFQAKDPDSGNNSRIFYDLSANSYFSLRQTIRKGGLKHLQLVSDEKLDFEREQTVNMILSASDGGNPPMRSEISLNVNVVDVNDNAPSFDQEEYRITLLENSSPGLVVDTVNAQDGDSGALGEVRYSISRRNTKLARKLFAIDQKSGELRLREKVDRERHNGVRVLIEARDSDPVNQKMGEAWLIVNVEDLNDNAPEISVLYILQAAENTVYIRESAQKGSVIMRISATDADSSHNGRVQLTMDISQSCEKSSDGDVTDQGTFVLRSDGLVATVQPLDRETCDEYIIMISACDHGNPSKCSSKAIKVKVLDENESAPKFRASTQRVTIPEDTHLGARITTVRAFDGDSVGENALAINSGNEIIPSKNGVVEYILTKGARGPFSMNRKTGELRLLRQLDREDKDEWKITVTARDGALPRSLESGCTVIITVSDVNDNAPKFLNPRANNSLILASTVSDGPITKLMASDSDFGKNAEIHFKLLSEEQESMNSTKILLHGSQNASSSSFVLNPTTGELRLNFSRRNFSDILGMHSVLIQAYDMGEKSQKTNVTLRIQVTDLPIVRKDPNAAVAKFPLLIGACIGSTLILIAIVLGVVAAIRCRRTSKESKSYSLPKDDVIHDGIEKNGDVDAPFVGTETVVETVEIECPDKSRVTNSSNLMDDEVASTSRCDSVSKLSHEDMGYLSVARNADLGSPSHSDGDSGRGDSESDGVACRNHRRGDLSAAGNSNRLGANCTQQCVEFGHGDSCWMPLIKNPTTIMPPINRPLCRISETGSPHHSSGFHNNRHPHRGLQYDQREYRSPSRTSNLEDNIVFMKRTQSNSNFCAYDMNYQAPSRCMSPSYGHLQNPQGYSIPSSTPGYIASSSCLVMSRASVTSNSNLLAENEKYGPSSSATNFLINYHHGNTKINAENAQKSVNTHCQPSTSTSHMSAINVPCSVPPTGEHFVGGSVSPYVFSSPAQEMTQQACPGETVVPSSSMLV